MIEHRYILEPYKGMNSRHQCPSCESVNKSFSLYIDTETGDHVHPTVGRCNRESNCCYHYTPKKYFIDHPTDQYAPVCARAKSPVLPQKDTSYIPFEILKASLKGHDENHFVAFLNTLLGVEVTNKLISNYFIGASNFWPGATVFFQIDQSGKIRTAKIMLYDATTGKRIKEPYNHINWLHSVLKLPEFNLRQCLFGEHLLKLNPASPVAIVESEKTAIIASVYLPEFIWLASGSLTNLNAEKCTVLKGRNVTLFPDLRGFDKWNIKAKELSFNISDLLERKATEAEKIRGLDLADYLIRFGYKEFLNPEPQKPATPLLADELFEQDSYFSTAETQKSEAWEQDITELEIYFNGIKLPTLPVKLKPGETITDVAKFIESHLSTMKANNGNTTFLPYLHRLQELKQYLTTNKN